MAKARSRRLRKKLHVGEFQEIGFDVDFSFKEGSDIQVIDTVVDEFIAFVEEQGLEFGGGGYINWAGVICLQEIGKCSEAHRELVEKWLKGKGLENVIIGELCDVWWD